MSTTLRALPLAYCLLTGCSGGEGDSPSDDSGGSDTSDPSQDGPEVIDCGGVDAQVSDLSFEELDDLLDQEAQGETNFLLINVHVPHGADIAGTDENISYLQMENLKSAIGELGTKAVVYCRTGPMSSAAAGNLVDAGFCNIFDLPGGYSQWENEGYAMER